MIWSKTEAGRREIQSRERVQARAQRTLLLLIDGVRTDATLLASVAGVTPADFDTLHGLGLIAPAANGSAGRADAQASSSGEAVARLGDGWAVTHPGDAGAGTAGPADGSAPVPDPSSVAPASTQAADRRALAAALTQLIPTHLGVRGFTLTLAVERASSLDELRSVAERAIEAIARRRGDAVAADARRTLFGR
ncbi:hypothetical protein [Piscinibacter koreensis]|uniref:Uncharacterized protein n=1 Tax=Piscinibacter koreensis TaxID=2742824 RepID=A0A7Y6TV25_9BURK|nr:hypothetical protein [Schlegelella koreensis]NUZ04491.1 hypothetical protein [Schlegelella koreensis]